MIGRTAKLLALLTVLVGVVPFGSTGEVAALTAGARQEPTDTPASSPLEVTAVSPWVASDGEFKVDFAPTDRLPEGAELTWTIHQSLVPSRGEDLRDQVRRIIDGESAGRILQSSVTMPFTDLGDPADGSTLSIPIRAQRSSSERVLLPNPGIHPVDLVLTDAGGTVLWTEVVFLNRLPDPDRDGTDVAAEPLRVSLVLPLDSPPAIAPDGSAAIDPTDREQLTRAGSLLSQVPSAPLLVAARPNTIEALTSVDEFWADGVLDALAPRTGGGGQRSGSPVENHLLGRPYVGVDAGGLVTAGATDVLAGQLLLGVAVATEVTGRTPVTATYALDDTVSEQALGVFRGWGTQSLLVPRSRLDLGAADGVDDLDAVTRPMNLAGGDGMQVLAYDEDLATLLVDGDVEPGIRAHQVAAVLMSSWFTAREDGGPQRRASAIVVPPSTDPEVIDALTPALTAKDAPLVAAPDGDALAPPTAEDPGTEVALAPRAAPDQRPAATEAKESLRQLQAYRSMVGTADPALSVWDDLNAESVAASLDAAERETLHATIRTGISGNLAAIELPPSRSVVVTSQANPIPLRFRNGLPFDVTLVMRTRSPRLDIEGGETREIVLHPGENRIDLPVEVQAPGESLLRIELSSPDGGITLPTTAIPVRSTAVSGVGAALSVLSILFLAGWWYVTNRRARRQRAEDSGTHPAGSDDADDGTTSVSTGG